MRREAQWRTYKQNDYADYITRNSDPWGYDSWTAPVTQAKFDAAIELLSMVGHSFERAFEIGCAQGAMTERLAPLCHTVLAVDYVPMALARAASRCRETTVCFARWDLASDPVPGHFDLIVIADVLGSFGGRRAVRRVAIKLANALTPGGYLLYVDFIGDRLAQLVHDSWLGRWVLFRPNKILRIFTVDAALVEITRRTTEMHLLALLQKRATA